MKIVRLMVLVGGLCALTLTADAADWPQWRGPDRTGVSKETGLLKAWPKDGPPKLWSVKGCGSGFSSVAVTGDVIYGTGSNRGKNVAWALKVSDGTPVWETPYADGGDPNA